MEPLILTFDIGTQSVRALLARKDGSFLDIEQYTYEEAYFSPQEYWAEQKPDFYFNALCKVSKTILERNRNAIPYILNVTITTIRDTVLCLDKDMQPLRNIIVWLDSRGAKFSPSMVDPVKRLLFSVVGMTDTIELQGETSACNWIMQNEPELWDRTAHYVYLSTYLNYLLTGQLKDSSGSLIGHMPMDYKKKEWLGRNGLTRCVFDIPNEKLCEIIKPGDTVGVITDKASELTGIPAGLELVATAADKGCETLGLSVKAPGTAAVSFGTSATIQLASEKYIEPATFIPPYPGAIDGIYNPELQIYRGYWMLTWYISQFAQEEARTARELGIAPEQVLNDHLKDVPMGSDGLFIQPYWSAGVTTPNARGSMLGFNDRQTKYHIYRAIIEGINYELYAGLKNLERRSKSKITAVFASGGGSKSDEIMQIAADMFGIPVKRIQTHEACGLGAAMIGFVHAGEFADYDEAIAAMVHIKDVFEPDMDNHAFYLSMYKGVYSGVFRAVQPLYKKLKQLRRGSVSVL